MSDPTATPDISPGQYLSRTRLERLLAQWEPGPDQPASSLYLRPGEIPQFPPLAKGGEGGFLAQGGERRFLAKEATGGFLESSGGQGRHWRERLSPLGSAALDSDTGIVGLRSGERALVVLPPFPVTESRLADAWDPGPLLALLDAEYTVGVALVRLGRFLVAVYQGERLLSSKTDSRYVKGKHHAGGTSQKRFQRIREGQARQLYDKVCEAVQAQFGPYARRLDYVLLGGDRFTLSGLLKVCPYLERLRNITLNRRLNVRDPKYDTLKQVSAMLRESRGYPVRW